MAKGQWQKQLVKWRRHLHQYPELSFEEKQTTAYIIRQIKGLPGVSIQSGKDQIGLDTGVIATVGDGERPVIGLRADIDALPITEETKAPYQSCHTGVMHACGHDGHTAMLIGAVYFLSSLYEANLLHGTVKCLFQPAEETEDQFGKTGAQYVLNSGALDEVEACFALHLDPDIPIGEVKLKAGVAMANVDTFTVTIQGTGGHGAYPEQSVDPIYLSSLILPYLYSLPSRQTSALEPSVLSVCQITGGVSSNVIPSEVTIRGTMRTYSEKARNHLSAELDKGLAQIEALGGSYRLYLHHGEPALINDPDMVNVLSKAIRLVDPNVAIHSIPYGLGGEDFSHITKQIPGAMMFLGAADQNNMKTSLHQPSFCFDERALEIGTHTLVKAALLLMKKGGIEGGT
ncbi:M20 metallopeptidase family protein [Halalkalibacter alkaliphilus]|uniref:M20 family metallopeptidase n=1 Tax=Halalkalibacter alkaliphilus TaxID=2917993 RepID=A0A9X2CQP2_9BACI|nr:M20 family metallopeptidase [Halalkalibacter alkaliphilus]MCL7745991.1 M20 family metallopeptidase [Halalkalibacter alkaliphilus]